MIEGRFIAEFDFNCDATGGATRININVPNLYSSPKNRGSELLEVKRGLWHSLDF